MFKHYLSVIALLIMVVLAAGSVDSGNERGSRPDRRQRRQPAASAAAPPARAPSTSAEEWYSGGTLHQKSALDWQAAPADDKLATCADFVTGMWKGGDLKPSITSDLTTVDDVRPYAEELAAFLDAAFEPHPDPEENRRRYANQTVAGTAAIGMVTMGWTK